eukprot:gene24858-45534_t
MTVAAPAAPVTPPAAPSDRHTPPPAIEQPVANSSFTKTAWAEAGPGTCGRDLLRPVQLKGALSPPPDARRPSQQPAAGRRPRSPLLNRAGTPPAAAPITDAGMGSFPPGGGSSGSESPRRRADGASPRPAAGQQGDAGWVDALMGE